MHNFRANFSTAGNATPFNKQSYPAYCCGSLEVGTSEWQCLSPCHQLGNTSLFIASLPIPVVSPKMGQPYSAPQHVWDLMHLTTWTVSFQQFASCQECCHLSQHHEKMVQLTWQQILCTPRQLTWRWLSRCTRWLLELWFGSEETTCKVFISNLIYHFQRSFCYTAFAYCRQMKGMQSSKDINSHSRMQRKCSTRKTASRNT